MGIVTLDPSDALRERFLVEDQVMRMPTGAGG
jgi:hypothetical protein